MKLLAPDIKPIKHSLNSFATQFESYAKSSDEIRIVTGYISTSSLLFLKEN